MPADRQHRGFSFRQNVIAQMLQRKRGQYL